MATIRSLFDFSKWRVALQVKFNLSYILLLTRSTITDTELKKAYTLAVDSQKLINGLITYLTKRKPTSRQAD